MHESFISADRAPAQAPMKHRVIHSVSRANRVVCACNDVVNIELLLVIYLHVEAGTRGPLSPPRRPR